MNVKAKKHLGQHFLTDENIAQKIVEGLCFEHYNKVLEIGPGTGVLTKYLLEKKEELLELGIIEMRERYKSLSPEIIIPFKIEMNLNKHLQLNCYF